MIGSCAPVLSTYIPQRLGSFSITHYLDSLTEVMALDDILYQRPPKHKCSIKTLQTHTSKPNLSFHI